MLYGRVYVPIAVHREVTHAQPSAPGAALVAAASWIESRHVADRSLVDALSLELDPGEAEAIALAMEVRSDLLLIDERRGRAAAKRLGTRVIGVLGILVEAKQRGLVPALRPMIAALEDEAGFRISAGLRERVLHVAGEQSGS